VEIVGAIIVIIVIIGIMVVMVAVVMVIMRWSHSSTCLGSFFRTFLGDFILGMGLNLEVGAHAECSGQVVFYLFEINMLGPSCFQPFLD